MEKMVEGMGSAEEKIAELKLNLENTRVEELKLYQSGIRFKCQQCATFCCKLGGPKLSERDIQRLKQIRSNAAEFLDVQGCLKNKEDGSCVFLEFDAKNNVYECSVYDLRPTLCRLYPFHAERSGPNSYTLKLIPCCKGLNNKDGELVNGNFIVNHLLNTPFDLSCM